MSDLSGQFRTTHKKLASGRVKIYYFTKPGGTRFFDVMGPPLSQPFPDAFKAAHRNALRSEGEPSEGDMAQMIIDYLASQKFQKLAAETQKGYRYSLEIARKKFGKASVFVVEDRRFRGKIISWQEEMAKTSARNADLRVIALSNALGYAHRKGKLLLNPAANIEHLYENPGNKQPWSEGDQALFLTDCPQDSSDAFLLGVFTGMRRTDLVAVTWDMWKGDHIELRTSKGRGKRIVIIPLTDDGQAFLAGLKQRQLGSKHGLQRTLLVGSRGRSLKAGSLNKKINVRAKALQIHKTTHQLRNTYATLLVKAGFKPKDIAGIMGWSVAEVDELIRIYVNRDVIVAAQVRRLKTIFPEEK